MFSNEEKIISNAEQLLSRKAASGGAFKRLLTDYGKLLRQAKRLVTMGDRMQNTLNELNRKVRINEEKYKGIFHNATEGIFRSSPDGVFIEVNPAMAMIFGYPSPGKFVLGAADLSVCFKHGDDFEKFKEHIETVGQVMDYQAEMVRRDGVSIWAHISVQRLGGGEMGEIPSLVGVVLDVTERKLMMEKMCRLARTDSLTGLYNRGYFMELAKREFSRAVRYGKCMALLMVDVDYFKKINDTYGHDVGDRVLVAFADLLNKSMRDVDIVARFGGEEFVILMPETGIDAGRRAAERIRESVQNTTVRAGGEEINFTACLGLTAVSPESTSLDDLLKDSDVALYAAKRGGRNRVEEYPVGLAADAAQLLAGQ